MGEGAAALVLENAEAAEARGATILGYVLGCGEKGDGFHRTRSSPDGTPIIAAIREAIDDAGLEPDDIDYVNAHGTGTPENDKMESMGCMAVMGERMKTVPISSNKSMIGHTLTAAGAVEAVFSLLTVANGRIPPTINYRVPDPAIPLDVVPNEARDAAVAYRAVELVRLRRPEHLPRLRRGAEVMAARSNRSLTPRAGRGEVSRRVLVTGGAKGVGAAIVRALAEAGHDIDFTYRSSAEAALALADELRRAHPDRTITAHSVDLADKGSIETFCGTLETDVFFGFVHNAGQPYDVLAAMMDQDKAEAAMQVNFWSLTRLAKTLLRGMIRARAGRIVAIGSVAALKGNPGNAAYAASKGALLSYCRTLAVETAKRGITVNYIAPGFIDTDMMAPYAAYRADMEKQIPAGRFAEPGGNRRPGRLPDEPAGRLRHRRRPAGRRRPHGDDRRASLEVAQRFPYIDAGQAGGLRWTSPSRSNSTRRRLHGWTCWPPRRTSLGTSC